MRHAGRIKRLSARDQAEWDNFARLVKPLAGKPIVAPPAPADAPIAISPSTAPVKTPAPVHPVRVTVDRKPTGLDTSSWKRFTDGKMRAQARLDLHGCTVNQACDRLVNFLEQSHATGLRCVEVITGLGQGAGGVIRHELPFWLTRADCAPLLLAVAHSSPTNHGAVRLLLRRAR